MMKETNIYLYTVSDRGHMYKDLIKSINSLLNFVTPNQIMVIHTPDVNWDYHDGLSDKGINNIVMDNELKPFNIVKDNSQDRFGYYGEKIAKLDYPFFEDAILQEVDNVMFLDCDTVIMRDVERLFDYKFDVAIRIDKGFVDFNISEWVKQFNDLGLDCVPMCNTGVMLFKNGYHKIISKYAKDYYNNVEWRNFHKKCHFDQYAITCAISKCMGLDNGFNVWWLDNRVHGMRWENDIIKPYIKHGSRNKVFRKIFRKIKEYVYYVS